jgi:hypothetical protein
MRVKRLSTKDGCQLSDLDFGNFHYTGSVKGMKAKYYGKNALLVRQGQYIYDVTSRPDIYNDIAY